MSTLCRPAAPPATSMHRPRPASRARQAPRHAALTFSPQRNRAACYLPPRLRNSGPSRIAGPGQVPVPRLRAAPRLVHEAFIALPASPRRSSASALGVNPAVTLSSGEARLRLWRSMRPSPPCYTGDWPWLVPRDGNEACQPGASRPFRHCRLPGHGRSRRLCDLRRLFTVIAVKSLPESKTLRAKSPSDDRRAVSRAAEKKFGALASTPAPSLASTPTSASAPPPNSHPIPDSPLAPPPPATGLFPESVWQAATPGRQCAGGFTEAADETLTNHFLAVFVPPNCRGSDGRTHEEGDRGRGLCGLTAPAPGALDDHFLAVFTPVGSIGRDGARHQPTRPRNGT